MLVHFHVYNILRIKWVPDNNNDDVTRIVFHFCVPTFWYIARHSIFRTWGKDAVTVGWWFLDTERGGQCHSREGLGKTFRGQVATEMINFWGSVRYRQAEDGREVFIRMEGIERVQRARPNQRMLHAPVWPYSDCTATEISCGHSWKTKQSARVPTCQVPIWFHRKWE